MNGHGIPILDEGIALAPPALKDVISRYVIGQGHDKDGRPQKSI